MDWIIGIENWSVFWLLITDVGLCMLVVVFIVAKDYPSEIATWYIFSTKISYCRPFVLYKCPFKVECVHMLVNV